MSLGLDAKLAHKGLAITNGTAVIAPQVGGKNGHLWIDYDFGCSCIGRVAV
jgi:hypothetical protein